MLGLKRRAHPNLRENAISWAKGANAWCQIWINLCKKDGRRAQILSVGYKSVKSEVGVLVLYQIIAQSLVEEVPELCQGLTPGILPNIKLHCVCGCVPVCFDALPNVKLKGREEGSKFCNLLASGNIKKWCHTTSENFWPLSLLHQAKFVLLVIFKITVSNISQPPPLNCKMSFINVSLPAENWLCHFHHSRWCSPFGDLQKKHRVPVLSF
jgi:hypothetical protein